MKHERYTKLLKGGRVSLLLSECDRSLWGNYAGFDIRFSPIGLLRSVIRPWREWLGLHSSSLYVAAPENRHYAEGVRIVQHLTAITMGELDRFDVYDNNW